MKHSTRLIRFLPLLLFCACNLAAPEPPQTCTDGFLNQDETGIDCGGVCTPCPTCVDGIQNQGELDIDCGGPCVLECFVAPPCNPDTNTIEVGGWSPVALTSFSHRVDWSGNHTYRLGGSGSNAVEVTFSATYNFVASGLFALNAFVGGSLPMNEIWIKVSTDGQVYTVFPGDAYVHNVDDVLTVTICGLTTSNQNISTTSTGNFSFPAIH